jgi:hypothetical protein
MLETVVLVVYGWKSVQPGTLSWVFPSVASAVHAAHAMTNAVSWAIVTGGAARATMGAALDLAKLRSTGGVLLEVAGSTA